MYNVCVQAKCWEHCSSVDLKPRCCGCDRLTRSTVCRLGTIDRNDDHFMLTSLFGTEQILIWYPSNWRGGTGGKRDLNYRLDFSQLKQNHPQCVFVLVYHVRKSQTTMTWRQTCFTQSETIQLRMWLFTLPNVCLIRFDVIFPWPIFISLWSWINVAVFYNQYLKHRNNNASYKTREKGYLVWKLRTKTWNQGTYHLRPWSRK